MTAVDGHPIKTPETTSYFHHHLNLLDTQYLNTAFTHQDSVDEFNKRSVSKPPSSSLLTALLTSPKSTTCSSPELGIDGFSDCDALTSRTSTPSPPPFGRTPPKRCHVQFGAAPVYPATTNTTIHNNTNCNATTNINNTNSTNHNVNFNAIQHTKNNDAQPRQVRPCHISFAPAQLPSRRPSANTVPKSLVRTDSSGRINTPALLSRTSSMLALDVLQESNNPSETIKPKLADMTIDTANIITSERDRDTDTQLVIEQSVFNPPTEGAEPEFVNTWVPGDPKKLVDDCLAKDRRNAAEYGLDDDNDDNDDGGNDADATNAESGQVDEDEDDEDDDEEVDEDDDEEVDEDDVEDVEDVEDEESGRLRGRNQSDDDTTPRPHVLSGISKHSTALLSSSPSTPVPPLNLTGRKRAAAAGLCLTIDPQHGSFPPLAVLSSPTCRPAPPSPSYVNDTTDFVPGTLDEDQPVEVAYAHALQDVAAGKRDILPQDIDPTYPDEEPDEDEQDSPSSHRISRNGGEKSPVPARRKLAQLAPHFSRSPLPVLPRNMGEDGGAGLVRTKSLPWAPRRHGVGRYQSETIVGSSHKTVDRKVSEPTKSSHVQKSDTQERRPCLPQRAAIAIVKGLERKRIIRKIKRETSDYQNAQSKLLSKGLGCEKMKQIGLEGKSRKADSILVLSV